MLGFLIWLRHAVDVLKIPTEQEEGQGLVEYALIMILVALVAMGMLVLLGPTVSNMFQNIVDLMGGNT